MNPHVLDANLRALLTRAYVPVRPSSAFRERLARELGRELERRPQSRIWRLAAAAALLAVAGLALRLALPPARSEPGSLVRVDGSDWRPLSAGERQRGVEYERGTLELRVVTGRHETLWLGAHGSVRLDGGAELRVADGALELGAGRARFERLEAGPAWRITAAGVVFELASGSLRLEQQAPELSARLDSGSATFGPGHEALPGQRELVFRDGVLLARPAELDGSGSRPARIAFGAGTAAPAAAPPEPGAPALRFAGRLLGPDGAPWSQEFTLALVREERLPDVARAIVRPFRDAEGRFDFPVARAGRYTLFALAAGQATLHRAGLEPASAPKPLELRLESGLTLRGRVLDAAGGAPLAGVTVLSEDDAPAQILDFDPAQLPAELSARALTDAQGNFVLEHLSSGLHTLRASAAGRSAVWSGRVDARAAAAEVELLLGAGGTIEAQIEPARADALLVASAVDYSFQRPCLSYALARTDESGRARFEHLPPGPFVVLLAEAEVTTDVSFSLVRAGALTEVHLGPVASDHALAGRLVDTAGVPLAGLDLMLQSEEARDGVWHSRRTDADGRFHFDGVRSGHYSLFAGDLGRNFVEIDRPEVGALDVVREIVLSRGAITGRVRTPAGGAELPQAWLVVQKMDQGSWRFAGKTQADEHGAWRFENLAPGTWRVVAYARSERLAPTPSQPLVLDASGDGVETEIALGPGSALELRVRDARGEPCGGASVELRDASGERWSFSPADQCDPAGLFAVPGLPPGSWTIRVAHKGCADAERTIQLEVDQLSSLEIHLLPR